MKTVNVRGVAATKVAGRVQRPGRAGPLRAIANRPGKVSREPAGDRFVGAGDAHKPEPEQGRAAFRGQRVSLFDFPKISEETLSNLEVEVLDSGEGIAALRRFNDALDHLSQQEDWEALMEPVWAEMAFNLESFNPIFTACLLKVQCTIGSSDYAARDACLQGLIQPLAGEYGLHEGDKLGKTHRQLFSDWYTSVTGKPLSHILGNESLKPEAGQVSRPRRLPPLTPFHSIQSD